MNAPLEAHKPRTLAVDLAERLGTRVADGHYAPGAKLPKEAALMAEFGVSRTVVREAISNLQASGKVHTRHGIGTFVLSPEEALPFRIEREQLGTLSDVIALLEVRIGLETEGAALAASRRTNEDLAHIRRAIEAFSLAVQEGRHAVDADLGFHSALAQATGNPHFKALLTAIGSQGIPRSRLAKQDPLDAGRLAYLQRVQQEHEAIYNAIEAQDPEAARAAMRTHLSNSRDRLRRRQNLVAPPRKVSLLVR
jgi:GntR family transcriptional repressor for pyruvate dehydrogenase complex